MFLKVDKFRPECFVIPFPFNITLSRQVILNISIDLVKELREGPKDCRLELLKVFH